MSDDLLAVRTPMVTFHVLRDAAGLCLIDTGFGNGPRLLRRELKRKGWDRLPVHTILLTHGHIDHALNAKPFAERFGAKVVGPRLDADFYLGQAKYSGITRITGFSEEVARRVFRYQPFTPDVMLDGGDAVPVWGGLRAVALPGHTPGHTGYYCPRRRVLFSGDLFNSLPLVSMPPPFFLNWSPEQIPASLATAAALDLTGVYPAHGDDSPPHVHLARLRRLHRSHAR
jgi:glyoxylase-like metal-dependent hydrolase (beta-lactamase superfamily II)